MDPPPPARRAPSQSTASPRPSRIVWAATLSGAVLTRAVAQSCRPDDCIDDLAFDAARRRARERAGAPPVAGRPRQVSGRRGVQAGQPLRQNVADARSLTARSPVSRHSIPREQSTASKRVGSRTAEPAEWRHILVGSKVCGCLYEGHIVMMIHILDQWSLVRKL